MVCRRSVRLELFSLFILVFSTACGSDTTDADGAEPQKNRWYAPGQIENRSKSITVSYFREGRLLSLAPGKSTGPWEDADHVLDPASKRWCKIGGAIGGKKATVSEQGRLEKCPECWVKKAGEACGR